MRDWLRRNPDFVGVLVGALVASIVTDAFAYAVQLGEARALAGEADRLVSEALGG